MLMFVWMCVMTSAFFPGGERLATLQANSCQSQIRASVDRPVMTLGWTSRDMEETVLPTLERSTVQDRIRAAQAALEAMPAPKPRARASRRAAA